jgi:alpha-2-macroglobulin
MFHQEVTNMQRKWRVVIGVVLILAVAGAGLWFGRTGGGPAGLTGSPMTGETPVAEVTLTPVKADTHGIDPAAGFLLKAAAPMNLREVEQALTVQPAAAVQVEAKSSKEFVIKPVAALKAGQVYRVELASRAGLSRAYNWSFQTQAAFRIVGTLPRNQGAGVPANTGIELIFSHEDYADADPYVTITPAVEGRFERHKKTLAFVPKNPLQPGTVYTVTAKAGLPQTAGEGKLAGDYTFTFETAPEQPNKGPYNTLHVPEELAEFPEGQAPYFQTWLEEKGARIDVAVYRYGDAAAFAGALGRFDAVPWWASYARMQYREETGSLSKVAAFQTELTHYDNYMGSYLHFPEALPAGYYLADLTWKGEHKQLRFQVTDLSNYVAVTTTETLVWLNDLTTGAPVAGAKVAPIGAGESATTDADGVAVLKTPGVATTERLTGIYLQAQAGGKEAVVVAPGMTYWYGGGPPARKDLYWKYLYLDRGLYRPDDTVHLWGIVRPREKSAAPIEQVTARITRGDWYGPDNEPIPLAETTLAVQDATFTGKLQLPGLKPGWYEVALYAGQDLLTTRYMEVMNYTKPAYKVEIKPDKQAVFTGEPVTFSAHAAFFEGTPVPDLRIDYSLDSRDGQMVTDSGGRASVTLRPTAAPYGNPSWQWYSIRAALPEAGEIADSGHIMVYRSDVLLRSETKTEADGRVTISGQVNQVDLTGVNAGTTWDVTGAPVAGRTVQIALIEENWIKQEAGEYYDFIQKTVHKLYNYKDDHKLLGTHTVTTGSDGTYRFEWQADPSRRYTATVSVADSKGTVESQNVWFSGKAYEGMAGSLYWGRYTHLAPTVEGKYQWKLGEPVTLEMRRDQAPNPDRPRGYLFYTSRLGLREQLVQDSGRFTYALKEADVPAIHVTGVYFDGRSYTEANPFILRLDPAERSMQVAITTDKESYRPGETVNVTVAVTDKAGSPVRAQVNLNLVDEALYALQDQRVDLLQSLYGEWVPNGVLRTRWSHHLPKPGFGAEKGGDGGGARKDFKDAIFFESVATDGSGRATASFKVPDNLTTWRLTYHAVEPGTMQAASGTTGVRVTLPFFVETVQNDTYLVGDRPVITARTYGTALQSGQTVTLGGRLQGPVVMGDILVTAKAYESEGFRLPRLDKAGTYAVTMSGEAPGGLKDAVEKPLNVVDTYLQQRKVDFHLLAPGAKVKGPTEGTVDLIVSDYARGQYLRLLGDLRWQWGNRFEQKLSRWMAGELLKQYTSLEQHTMAEEEAPDTFAYQAPDGSIAILPYADGDLYLSALAADLLPDGFDQASLEAYFTKVADSDQESRERKIQALYGMAAIGRPVLQAAHNLTDVKDLTLDEQLHLALAIAELGDLEGARPLYRAILAAHGERLGPDARIKTGRDQDEILTRTALAGMLAAKLGEAEGPAFAGYLVQNWGRDVLLVLEEAIMAADGLATAPAEAVSVTYVADGKEIKQELKPGQTQRLTVTAKQLSAMEFPAVTGQVALTVMYEAPLDRADLKQRDGFAVKRSYSVNGKETTTFRSGDLVKVTLTYEIPATAPGGVYELTDYLPSGLKRIEKPWQNGINWERDMGWPIDANGPKATYWASREAKYKTITYYARVITPGEYTAEEPVLQHQRSGLIYAAGGRQRVTIE